MRNLRVVASFGATATAIVALSSVGARESRERAHDVAIAAPAPFEIRRGIDTFASSNARAWSLVVDRVGGDRAHFQAESNAPVARADRTEIDRGHGVVEWLRVVGSNVEQGFDVARALDDSGRLRIAMSTPSLVAHVSPSSITVADVDARTVASIAGLVTRDARGRSLPSRFISSADRVDDGAFEIVVDVRDAVYPLVVDPSIAGPTTIPAYPVGVGTYYFGAALAIGGGLLVVGAPASPAFGSDLAIDPGSASAFAVDAGVWTPLTTLMPAALTDDESLGQSVATDGVTVVVGAPNALAPGSDAGVPEAPDAAEPNGVGVVYVFARPASGAWAPPIPLVLADAVAGDQFGALVLVRGDTIIVGAPGRASTSGPTRVGAFFDFERSGATWTLTGSPVFGPDDSPFVSSLALDGDRLVAGSEYAGPGGEITIYERTGAGAAWTATDTLYDTTEGVGEFGATVAIAGDYVFSGAWGSHVPGPYDDAGVDAAACDASSEPDAGTDGGACGTAPFTGGEGVVDVFHRDATGAWTPTQRLTAATPQPAAGFGNAIAASGSVLVVGEPGRSAGPNLQTGSATVFTLDGAGNWQPFPTLTPSTAATNDQFGYAVATDGTTVFVDELQGSGGGGVVQTYVISGLPDAGVDAGGDAVADSVTTDVAPDAAVDATLDVAVDATLDAPVDAGVDATLDAAPGGLATSGLRTCTADTDCVSGFCVDGACCNTRCDALCQSCVLAAAPGICLPQPYGYDLHHDCASSSCGTTCSAGACVPVTAAAQCAPSECVDGTHSRAAAYCASAGAACDVSAAVTTDCGLYACLGATGECAGACASSADCAPGVVCDVTSKLCVATVTQPTSGCAYAADDEMLPSRVVAPVGLLVALGLVRRARSRQKGPRPSTASAANGR